MAAAIFALGPPSSAVAKPNHKKPKPNLVVTRASASGPAYAFDGPRDEVTFAFKHTTENKGDAAAGRSRTALYLFAIGDRYSRRQPVVQSRVTKLLPGHSDRGGTSATIRTASLPLGGYILKVCADSSEQVEESNERNCVSTKRHFYVAQEDWRGSVHGQGGAGGIANLEHWNSDPAHLGFVKYLGAGAFLYEFIGVVNWTDHGIGGCIWNGSGSEPVVGGNHGIVLDYAKGRYKGKETLRAPFYTITLSGGGGFPCHSTAEGPQILDFLKIPSRHLGFGQDSLKGRAGSSVAESTLWTWDFT
jgi:hypothetical protein